MDLARCLAFAEDLAEEDDRETAEGERAILVVVTLILQKPLSRSYSLCSCTMYIYYLFIFETTIIVDLITFFVFFFFAFVVVEKYYC